MIREIGTGLIIGFCFGLFMEAVRFAGDLIGRTAGFAAAEFFNPDAGTMEGPWDILLPRHRLVVFCH